VVHGQRGDDEVERPRRQGVGDVRDQKVDAEAGQAGLGRVEHGGARVDAGGRRSGVTAQHGRQGLAGAGPQVEEPCDGDALGGPDDLVLETRVARDLTAHQVHVGVRVEVELAHPARMRRRSAAVQWADPAGSARGGTGRSPWPKCLLAGAAIANVQLQGNC
jgi:hypothetical protein